MPVPGYAICISIHTPARGVTEAYQKGGLFIGYFNPHSRKGSDTMGVTSTDTSWYFNPHSHKGSDRGTVRGCYPKNNFNPHSHKGSDQPSSSIQQALSISIHTPTRGVTITIDNKLLSGNISIHTPTRGVTKQGQGNSDRYPDFNPHSHKGSDS